MKKIMLRHIFYIIVMTSFLLILWAGFAVLAQAAPASPETGDVVQTQARPQGMPPVRPLLQASPALTVTKSVQPAPVEAGQVMTYTVIISNSGTSDATGTTISDTLPAVVTLVGGSVIIAPPSAGGAEGAQPIIAGGITVTAQSLVTVTYKVTVATPLAGGTVITNVASVTSTQVSTPTTAIVANTVSNSAPTANDDNASTNEDNVVIISVLSNDNDPNGDSLSVSSVGLAASGNTSTNGTAVTYTPDLNFSGTDTFTYAATDGSLFDTAAVTITINPVNDAPNGVNDSATVDEGGTVSIVNGSQTSLLLNDTDPESDTLSLLTTPVSDPSNGNVTLNSDGTFSYTHDGGETTGDSFVYRVCDGGSPSECDTATVNITINPVNDAPVLNFIGNKSVDEEVLLSFTVSATDADVPANTLTYSMVNTPTGATINSSSGLFQWTPTATQGPGVYPMTFVVSDDGNPVMTDSETVNITVVEIADVSINKTAAPGSVVAGSSTLLIYTLVVQNSNGPSAAANVVVTDTLPTGVTYGSANPSAGTCSQAGGKVRCELGSLGKGNLVTISIYVTVDSSTTGTLTNTAFVASDTTERVLTNNTGTAATTVNTEADLSIAKTASASSVLIHDSLTYTLTVTNSGPSDATGVVVTDTLPAGVNFTSASAGCSHTSGKVVCALNTLAAGAEKTATIVVTPMATGSISNQAEVDSNVSDPAPANNSDDVSVTVLPKADLSISKTDSADPVLVGDYLTYTLTISNNGPSNATSVVVTDTLPANISLVHSGGCGFSLGKLICNLNTVSSGNTKTVTIVVRPTTVGLLNNSVEVSSDVFDPDPNNNTDTESTTVTTEADLSISKYASPEPVAAGATLTYTLAITNNGPSVATGVVVTDTLPAGVSLNSVQPSQGSCTQAGGVVTCTLGSIANAHSASIALVVAVDPAAAAGTLTNTAGVVSDQVDPQPNDNNASASTTVVVEADLSLNKTAPSGTVLVNNPLTYTLTISNSGPSDATGVVVTDTLPLNVTLISAPGCTESGGIVTCPLGNMASGDTDTVTIVVKPTAIGSLDNSAVVESDVSDPDSSNNTDTANTTVFPKADLSISKTASAGVVVAGNILTYTLTVTNYGPSNATGVMLTDTLPAGVSLISSPGCSATGGDITCSLGAVGNGSTPSTIITVRVNPSTQGTLINNVTVGGGEFDPDISNNMATATTIVTDVADLSLGLSASPDPVVAGSNLTYTLTISNNGPSDATGVTLSNNLPTGVTFISASAGCAESGGVVTCPLGNIAHDNSDTVIISVRVYSDTTGTLNNTASVTGNEADPDTGNNSATVDTFARPSVYHIFLPVVLKIPPPMTDLSIFNKNTGGNVTFSVLGTNVSCTVPNNITQFCGSFSPGTYNVYVVSRCGTGTFSITYEEGPQTTPVFCE